MPREISDISRLKQKRGIIDLNHPENYIPWIKATECFKGDGTRHQIQDLYYEKRTIHLMSDLEKDVYYTLRSNRAVIELFEQYPLLPLNKTKDICEWFDIRHPKHPYCHEEIVMTTDFLIMYKEKGGGKSWLACAVKHSSDMVDKRKREKLFIEKKYWESMGIPWGFITEKHINKTYVKNIILCRSGFSSLGERTVYDAIKYLIAKNELDVDMNQKLDLDNLVTKY